MDMMRGSKMDRFIVGTRFWAFEQGFGRAWPDWIRLGILAFRGSRDHRKKKGGNPEIPESQNPDFWVSGFRVLQISPLDHPGRIAGHDHAGGNVLDHHCPGSDHAVVPDRHPRPDKGVGADPYTAADCHRLTQQGQVGLGMVVGAGTEVSPLGDGRVVADLDGSEVVDRDAVAQDRLLPDCQQPGMNDVGGRAGAAGG